MYRIDDKDFDSLAEVENYIRKLFKESKTGGVTVYKDEVEYCYYTKSNICASGFVKRNLVENMRLKRWS